MIKWFVVLCLVVLLLVTLSFEGNAQSNYLPDGDYLIDRNGQTIAVRNNYLDVTPKTPMTRSDLLSDLIITLPANKYSCINVWQTIINLFVENNFTYFDRYIVDKVNIWQGCDVTESVVVAVSGG